MLVRFGQFDWLRGVVRASVSLTGSGRRFKRELSQVRLDARIIFRHRSCYFTKSLDCGIGGVHQGIWEWSVMS
jgi:hypothetical protein